MFTKEELVKIKEIYLNAKWDSKESIELTKQLWANVLLDVPLTHKLLNTVEIGGIIQEVFPGALPGVSHTQLLAKLATTFFLFGYNTGKAVEQNKKLEDILKKE